MPFSAILLVFKFLVFSFLQVCKFTDLQVHNSIDCPYFYGLSVKISDLLHLMKTNMCAKNLLPIFLIPPFFIYTALKDIKVL